MALGGRRAATALADRNGGLDRRQRLDRLGDAEDLRADGGLLGVRRDRRARSGGSCGVRLGCGLGSGCLRSRLRGGRLGAASAAGASAVASAAGASGARQAAAGASGVSLGGGRLRRGRSGASEHLSGRRLGGQQWLLSDASAAGASRGRPRAGATAAGARAQLGGRRSGSDAAARCSGAGLGRGAAQPRRRARRAQPRRGRGGRASAAARRAQPRRGAAGAASARYLGRILQPVRGRSLGSAAPRVRRPRRRGLGGSLGDGGSRGGGCPAHRLGVGLGRRRRRARPVGLRAGGGFVSCRGAQGSSREAGSACAVPLPSGA